MEINNIWTDEHNQVTPIAKAPLDPKRAFRSHLTHEIKEKDDLYLPTVTDDTGTNKIAAKAKYKINLCGCSIAGQGLSIGKMIRQSYSRRHPP